MMKATKPYKDYKLSTIGWLGNIPAHWEVKRIKYVFKEQDKRSETGLENLLSVSHYTGVTKKSDKLGSGDRITNAKTLVGYKIVEEGDLVINIMLAWNGSLGISKFDGITSPAYCVYKSLIGGERYFGYLFRTKNAQQEFKKQSTGIIESRLRLYSDKFFNISTAIPTNQEQIAVANFLDNKTAKIDRFIFKKKQLIKLLNEQKAGIINDAVTKGLNHKAKTKASGIEWLEKIPEHWEVKKLKYLAESVLGKMLCNEDKGNYLKKQYLKSKNIQWLNVDVSDVEEMWFSEKELIQYRLKKGDLVLSEGGEVGKTCLWNEEIEECYIQNSAHKVTFHNKNVAEFYLYLFFLYGNKGAFEAITNKVSIGHLTKDKLINLKCVCPSLQEQSAIVSYIEKETSIINKTIETIQKEILLVQEYRTAIIAEAVTGKIDVREYEFKNIKDETYELLDEELSLAAEDEEEYIIQESES